ncbi:hypothetical protein PV326_012142 [Microctonus aethiopoides]|nr:hypothetical protein PV326_012142 [Microctonus aethiopoides]
MQSPTSGDAQKSNASKFTSFKVASSKEYGTEYAWWCSGIDTGGASPCIIFLALLVANDPSVVNGVVSGDARCVVLQRRSRINEGGPGELGSPYTGASCLRGLELRGFNNVGAMRQRRRERQWHREDLQAFEEDLRLPIGAEEEDFDFLGIRWMQDGR